MLIPYHASVRRLLAVVVLLPTTGAILAGCGTSAHGNTPSPAAPASSAPAPAPTPTSAALESNAGGPPSFTTKSATSAGDQIRVEGWFGPAKRASESDVSQSALSECPQPAGDGRAVVVRLDLSTTIESGLSGEVKIETAATAGNVADFVLAYSEGPKCVFGQQGQAAATLGTLQPHQPHSFTMWAVLPDAITPSDPQPSEHALAQQGWYIAAFSSSINGTPTTENESSTGSRVVQCNSGDPQNRGSYYLTPISGTSHAFPCP
jgi:hypothetical protein